MQRETGRGEGHQWLLVVVVKGNLHIQRAGSLGVQNVALQAVSAKRELSEAADWLTQ